MRGRLAAKKCTDGSRIIFSYDSKDYLKSSSVMLPGQKLGTAYHYGSGSNNQPYKSRVYGVTITDATATKMLINTSSASDSLNRLASRSINAVGGKSLVYGYTYERGTTLPLTLSATVGDVSSTLVYTYDAAGNITSVTDGENVTRYCYDNMGQLIREDNPYSQKTCVYAYDNCGNILSRTEYGYTDDENPACGTVAVYEYNNAAWGDQLTAWNGESIRSKHLLRITVSDVFDFSELWFISNENTTIKNKILNDIGFCLENAQLMRQFSWSVSFDIPYWG